VQATALVLRQLGNNREFLGDLILDELSRRHCEDADDNAYGPQAIMLGRAGESCLLRASIWPSHNEPVMRNSGASAFVYGLPHDHNFDFLTLGYFGPGYQSDCFEADYGDIDGYLGEPIGLIPTGRFTLGEGDIHFYRAHVDVHAQMPAAALSVSLNILRTGGAQGWLDQYRFDVSKGEIAGQLAHGASEAFIHIAVGLGGEEALDLAERFAMHHPSGRMRLHALDAWPAWRAMIPRAMPCGRGPKPAAIEWWRWRLWRGGGLEWGVKEIGRSASGGQRVGALAIPLWGGVWLAVMWVGQWIKACGAGPFRGLAPQALILKHGVRHTPTPNATRTVAEREGLDLAFSFHLKTQTQRSTRQSSGQGWKGSQA
jgi:hypothetical protein